MKKLFENNSIGNIELKNRFIRSATWEWMADEKGHLTEKLIKVYEDLAKGGAAALFTGYAHILEDEQPNPSMMGAYNNSFKAEYKKLTDMVHGHDCKIFLQIVYGGSLTHFNADQRTIWGPSAIEHRLTKVMPVEMTAENIKALINAFGDAAILAKESGFDGVQFHAAHGYLLNLFLSPYYNQRTDNYGGSSENRARILYEVYDNIREKVGFEFPILMKINCSDFTAENGQTLSETKTICETLEKKGMNAIEISGGPVFKKPKVEKEPFQPALERKTSYFAEYAKEISKNLKIPVLLVGGNRSIDEMNEILNNTNISNFSLARPLLSEPDLIKKWQKDKDYKPRCTSCQKCFNFGGNMCILDKEVESD
jgi:2,4-dienoyl-CoA reductase-like NADH-dependent reductase (Old Yellow Enzyme family)